MSFHSSIITPGNGTATRRKRASLLPSLVFPFFLFFVTGCGGPALTQIREKMIHGPSRVQIAGIPVFTQKEYQCGPAALAMALTWSGVPTVPAALVSEVYSPALKGSLQPALVGAARRSGRLAYPISGTEPLLKEVAAGHPVIVLQNLGLS